jgi:ankyrin repeat protein
MMGEMTGEEIEAQLSLIREAIANGREIEAVRAMRAEGLALIREQADEVLCLATSHGLAIGAFVALELGADPSLRALLHAVELGDDIIAKQIYARASLAESQRTEVLVAIRSSPHANLRYFGNEIERELTRNPPPPAGRDEWLSAHRVKEKDFIAFSKACDRNDVEAARELLEGGLDPNGNWRDATLLFCAVMDNRTEIVELLLEAGADPNPPEEAGPLQASCVRGSPALIRTLIAHGADVHQRDRFGDTALHRVCGGTGFPESVRLLLDAGADPNVVDNNGDTPLDKARGKVKTTELLLQHGAKPRDGATTDEVLAAAKAEQAERGAAMRGAIDFMKMFGGVMGDEGMQETADEMRQSLEDEEEGA